MRLLATLATAAAVGLLATPGVDAHPVKECGAYGFSKDADEPAFIPDSRLDGAGTFNITARGLKCGTAHWIVRRWSDRCRRSVCYVGTFRCRTKQTGYELSDTRCTTRRSRHYIVRWQSGS